MSRQRHNTIPPAESEDVDLRKLKLIRRLAKFRREMRKRGKRGC